MIKKIKLFDPFLGTEEEKAVKKGMVTMKQDGLIKVLEGITTIEEIEKVMG